MRNISINAKMLVILGSFATFALGTAVYSSANMSSIDARYNALLTQDMKANVSLAKANRALQFARASIADLVMLRDPAAIALADNEMKRSVADFDRMMADAEAALPQEQQLKQIASEGKALLTTACQPTIDAGRKALDTPDIMAAIDLFSTQCQPGFPVLSDKIRAYATQLLAAVDTKSATLTGHVHFITASTLIGMIGGTLLVLLGAYFAIRTWLVRPINALRETMGTLATGDYSVDVREIDRRDEIGKMAATVEVFKRNGLEALALQKQTEELRGDAERKRIADQERTDREAQELRVAAESLGGSLQRLAMGDLTCRIETRFADVYENLRTDFNTTVDQLSRTVGAVRSAVLSMDGGTREIAAGARISPSAPSSRPPRSRKPPPPWSRSPPT